MKTTTWKYSLISAGPSSVPHRSRIPEAFDEYIVPYDRKIIGRLKEYGLPINMHCHGKVRHALECMVEMGVGSTDPVEPPPAGDVTFAQAREIAGQDRPGSDVFSSEKSQCKDRLIRYRLYISTSTPYEAKRLSAVTTGRRHN